MAANRQREYELLERGGPVGPRTYEVNIKAKPEELLDWDRRINEQSPFVQGVLKKFGWEPESYAMPGGALAPRMGGPTGEDAYRDVAAKMADRYGHRDRHINATYASAALKDEGVPGLRYLDQGSRPRAQLENRLEVLRDDEIYARANSVGIPDRLKQQITSLENQLGAMPASTYNYVGFDPTKLDIMAKYGVVGGVPIGMGAIAAQDQYEAAP
jgi:hypothetical protein